jgi:S-adenosylmethionine:tRNA ribosyltransferase-isomerase
VFSYNIMQLTDFIFELPEELIAKYPANERVNSRLLQVINPEINNSQPGIQHKIFNQVIELFNPGDLIVLNNTKVIPARFYGQKPTGAKIEFLLERVLLNSEALVHIKSNRSPKPGSIIELPDQYSVTVLDKQDNLYLVKLNQENISENTSNTSWYQLLDKIGKLPLPPYIERDLAATDSERYQTVYAKHLGAVAAPTAGLHFDAQLLALLQAKGIIIKYVTLHVGSGTFAPVRTSDITQHKMHSESYSISDDTIESIINLQNNNKNKQVKNKIIAVGTTSLRCLESIARYNYADLNAVPRNGDTDIFIYPGYKFQLVDCLITNFHLPGSTLMMLVSAFAGMQTIKHVYEKAIEHKYRFYSYGDAMWLERA